MITTKVLVSTIGRETLSVDFRLGESIREMLIRIGVDPIDLTVTASSHKISMDTVLTTQNVETLDPLFIMAKIL